MSDVSQRYGTSGGGLVIIKHADAKNDAQVPHDRAYELKFAGSGGRELLYETNHGGVSHRIHPSVNKPVKLCSNPRKSWKQHLHQFLKQVEKLDSSANP
jgi:hypothetical protein